jgi:hypothetical protein
MDNFEWPSGYTYVLCVCYVLFGYSEFDVILTFSQQPFVFLIHVCARDPIYNFFTIMFILMFFSEKFGLFQVDFSDPDRKRTAKPSAEFYSKIIKSNKIPA